MKHLQEQINLQEKPKVNSLLQQDEPTYSEATLGVSQAPKFEEHKVLGVPWNSESDQLIFDITNLAKLVVDLHPTKRNLVSLVGKFYDPLGFLSPVIIRFKTLFQKLCHCKSDWDKIIPNELVEEWKGLISDLNVAMPISLPRRVIKERSLTRAVVHRCTICKRYEGAPFDGLPPPPLPEFRIKEDPAFTYTGVDFAGLLFIHGGTSSSAVKYGFVCTLI